MEAAKTANGKHNGNTVILHKVKILFQIYPGISGTMEHRCIAGAEYKGTAGNMVFWGRTGEDGGVQLLIPAGETAKLEIFDTVFLVKLKTNLREIKSREGVQERLGTLGYYLGSITGDIDAETDRALLNFQADGYLNARGYSDAFIDDKTEGKLKIQIGE